jgi:subtilisin-like proprotein convertase family protein
MRLRPSIWILPCLLLAVAAAWFLRSHGVGVLPSKNPVATAPQISAAATGAAGNVSTAKNSGKLSTVKTNKFAYRLTNTKKTISQLAGDRHAILLENAFIDTDAGMALKIPDNLKSTGDPGAYIVQARAPIDNAFRAMLAAAGAAIVSYIPNDAYLVRVSAGGAGALSANALVQAVLPYEPYYKLQPSLLGFAVEQQPLPPGIALNLGLFAADAAATEQQLETLGAKIIATDQSPFGPVVRVLAPADWTALAQVPGVQIMEQAHQRVLANDLARVTLGISTDTVTSTNWLNLTGKNAMVAVDDSGVDVEHPDFGVTGSAETPGSATPSRVTGQNLTDLTDTSGHGTHVAGIIAGNGSMSLNPVNVGSVAEGSVTNADFRGKAPAATLFSINFNNPDYVLQTSAALTNALISNNSWGYGGDFDYDLAAASYDAATRDALPTMTGSQPVLFVFAAGDNGSGQDDGSGGTADTITSPGTAKNVITVGALEQLRNITNIVTIVTGGVTNQSPYWQLKTDSGSQVASYSSRGNVGVDTEGAYGRFKPDVVAPGTFVVSTSSGIPPDFEWDTNAYYNPTNVSTTDYTGQIVTTNLLTDYNVSVPPNAISVTITITTNKFSQPFPTNLFIYVKQASYPTTTVFDFATSNNMVSIPGDGGSVISTYQNNGFDFAVGDSTNVTVNYNLTVAIATTNDLGDYYQVLEGMNDSLGGYYRYESGTSMAAPAISGVLALIQDYFTNTLGKMVGTPLPSPALLKAMLINGSRTVGNYTYAVTNGNNFQGWGLPNIADSLPLTNNAAIPVGANPSLNSPLFFVDQSPTNALATGDSHTYIVTINTNSDSSAQFLQLQATLVWTDPAGDPAAAIKLVNNLDLVITNLDTGDVYFGNDISPDLGYNLPWATNGPPNLDTINNVENIILPPLLAGSYSVTVVGREVNVNAVTAQANNVVQDYALVVSVGEGEVPDAISSVTDNPIVSNSTGDQDITFITTTNQPLLNQFVGANAPLLNTNTVFVGGTNAADTLGQTNQWHFYVITNNAVDASGSSSDVTNAAFITFSPETLSIPRMGVLADSQADSTRPEADIDLYVTTDPTLTNLNPVVVSNCVNGTQVGASVAGTPPIFNGASVGGLGTEFVADTNSTPGEVYYVGVKSEDQMASEYAFLPVFTATPFSQTGPNGSQIVNGLLVPVAIPDGSPAHPGVAYVFALALAPMTVDSVTVTNQIEHQNFGDLFGALSHNDISDVLNSHDGFGNTFPPNNTTLVYDDSSTPVIGSKPSDGPGSLRNFTGTEGIGPWILTEEDNSPGFTGAVTALTLLIQPHQDLSKGIVVTVAPNSWFYDYVDVPAGYMELNIAATNTTTPYSTTPVQMYEKFGAEPTLATFDQEADLTNCLPGTGPFPAGAFPGNVISTGPPLPIGFYYIGIYNPTPDPQTIFLADNLVLAPVVGTYVTNGTPVTIPDDAVTSTSIFVSSTNQIASLNVGLIVTNARISDLAFTLISPTGQRILLMENRGGTVATNLGHLDITTNYFGTTTAGGAASSTNVIGPVGTSGTLLINYDFYELPDTMDIYYDGVSIEHFAPAYTGSDISGTLSLSYGPGNSTSITIVMNQDNNTNTSTAWEYTPTVVNNDYTYLTFTDDTNLTQTPIKFAIPPYDLGDDGTNFGLSDFELATNGDYFAPSNIFDAFGGWTLPTNLVTYATVFNLTNNQFEVTTNVVILTNNEVSVMADPSTASGGSNFLALADGVMTRTISVTPGRQYSLNYAYRGPGIAGWWRGEGNASDSSDPEFDGNNGSLIGRFDFPAGEVGQAFEMENSGQTYDFAGTNGYVQIRQVPSLAQVNATTNIESTNLTTVQLSSLDVGTGGGLTIEGWINPTNVSFQQPLVEWLARVPTNGADTNLTIEAGPFLDRATGHYYYMLGSTNWTISETWATQLGGHLVTVDTANEENWIYDTFASYAGVNRNLWIGFNDAAIPGTFVWSSGLTNSYVNWAPDQPTNCSGNDFYTAILGATNAYPGLWVLENNTGTNNNGVTCDVPPSNHIYGVVEVDDIQTNGVQFWISVTNTPGTTNTIVSSNACLYANLVDITNGSHEIFSAPGLVQSNVFQHVALTYDTNSGFANLYYDGTNVASTNLGVFIPKTTGDVLLGKDMSRLTNNYYGGLMDEMSIYRRALSDAEIAAIYKISAFSTNRNVGKFDPSITPPLSLAEAQVSLDTVGTNLVLGDNINWQEQGFTFTPATNSLQLQVAGIEPGLLLDSFDLSEASQGNLYYLPETSLDALDGESANGTWTLEIWDSRTGGSIGQLVSWQLQFTVQTNAAVVLNPQGATTNTVPPNSTVYYAINVPVWATSATNILVSSTQPVDLLFNQANPPTGTIPPDTQLLSNSTGPNAIGNPGLVANSPPLVPSNPPLLPGQTYYLGVKNSGSVSATVVVRVDFNMTALTSGVPLGGVLRTNTTDVERYFTFDVTSNAYEATFQLLSLGSNADLVVSKGAPLPTLTSSDYGSFNVSNLDENIYVLTNSSPVPLSAGRWYLGVFRRDSGPVSYTVLAKELDFTNNTSPAIISLTNGVPFNFTAGPGAALTNFFRFTVTNTITGTETNYVQGLRFELYNLTGNGDLTVQTNAPPLSPPFFQSSQNPGRNPELILIQTNSALTNLAADWYLGVPDNEASLINYTIVAEILTNGYFPAFPGASGSGGGAVGAGHYGVNSTVYHVTSTGDSGSGTLRDAVNATNRTVVFDISGTINLASPLIITNSYLTIAGQTAPGGGITVAGYMTALTNAHDVIIRDVRFRRGAIDDSLQFMDVSNVIADHVSAEWSSDNDLSVLNSTNVTVQWSILADSLYDANNPQGFGSLLRYGYGALSFHHNLYADNYNGSPRLGDNLSLDFVNNVIYNWGIQSGFTSTNTDLADNPGGFTNQLNYACNYLIAGADTAVFATNLAITNIAFVGGTTNTWIFQTNNFMDSDTNGVLNGANTQWNMFTNQYTQFGHPFPLLPVPTDEAFLAYEKVLDFAGPDMAQRDSVDTNIVAKVRTQTGTLISTPPLWGMVAWWKGEGNANDSAGTNNGTLIGGLGFAPGEVGQAFNFKDTNGYVFVPASPQLNVGTNSGFTVEAWINPSNISTQMPLVGWGTNAGPTGSNILAGPILNPANGHYYYLLQTNTWTASEAWAVALGGHLTTINDAAENSWVLNTFSLQGGIYRDLWTGLYDPNGDTTTVPAQHETNFIWSDGEPATYRNWNSGEPNNGSTGPTREYWTYMFSADQGGLAGVWNDLPNINNDTGGHSISGVVELSTAPGMYLWTSVTWSGGGGTGCLYANVVDSTNGSHQFSTASDIIKSNVYQHVALTYSTNSGIATLYLNGTSVASTNLGVFVPQTTGDVILGKRIGGLATDIYSGGMDEVTIYKRALSQAEIQAIYNAGSAGKFPVSSGSLYLDTDQDGIPDFWEDTFTTNLVFTPSNNNDRDGDGYTDLEEYNNWLARPHALTVTTNPVSVDLMQLCGKTGNLSFSVTNGVQGFVYLTNVLGSVTNTGTWSNSIAVFTPTNNPSATTNYSGYASFDVYVTNNDTVAWFGPVTVSVVASAATIAINSNSPPNIITLTNAIAYANINSGGADYYRFTVATNATAVLFDVTNATGPVTLVARYGLPLPSLSSYDYISTNSWTTSENIVVLTNSMPVALTNGDWYLAVVNVAGSNVTYSAKATELFSVAPPVFTFPTSADVFTNIETTLFTTNCVATDPNTPPLPLTFALVSGPTNMTVTANGVINWTPTEAQGPSTNLILVSVANAAFSVTNSFTVIVEESNLPPVLPFIPNQVVIVPGTLVVTNTATDPDIPTNPLAYTLLNPPVGAAIDANGVITWTPALTDVGSNYLFTTIVTDTNQWAVNSKSLSATNSFTVTVTTGVTGGTPQTNTVPAGSINWFAVSVPTNAVAATNLLYATNLPVNVWFSTNVPPTITNSYDFELLANTTSGTNVLTLNSSPTNIVAGKIYFLGVQNTNGVAVAYDIEVNFRLAIPVTTQTNTVSISGITHPSSGGTNGFLLAWFAPSNDLFQVQWTAGLAPASWSTFTNIVSYNTGALTSPADTQFNFLDDGSQTPPGLPPIRFYRLVLLGSSPAAASPAISNVFLNGSGLNLQWFAPTNDQFQVRWTTNLAPVVIWTLFPNIISSTNGTFLFTDTNAPLVMKFYQLMLLP